MRGIVFFAVNNLGRGLSGGDRIFIEFMRGWRARLRVLLAGSEEAVDITASRLDDVDSLELDRRNESAESLSLSSLLLHTVRRAWRGVAGVLRHRGRLADYEYAYSVSDFLPDVLPALTLKLVRPGRVTWLAGFYLFAPRPWAADNPYRGRHFVKGCVYWLFQLPSYLLVRWLADVVLVTSQPDVPRFVTSRRPASRVVVVRGGVDVRAAERYHDQGLIPPPEQRAYDACFVGRFHHQKGVLDLIEIWRLVTRARPGARLAVIGVGELEGEMRDKVRAYGLEDVVDFLGFMDGEAKEAVFRDARMMLHPASYDSGGMAAAEGMAWGLPGVSYDLEALKTYYPKGMAKVPPGDTRAFADTVLGLLDDPGEYARLSGLAKELVFEQWDWRRQSEAMYGSIFGHGTATGNKGGNTENGA